MLAQVLKQIKRAPNRKFLTKFIEILFLNKWNEVTNEFPKSVLKMHILLILYNLCFNSQSDKTTLDLRLYLDDAVKDKDEADQNQKAGWLILCK